MLSKIYQGYPGGRVMVHFGGCSEPLRHVVYYSPTGFSWGYLGSGPSDLAISILCDHFNEVPSSRQLSAGSFHANKHWQAFLRDFVAGWRFRDGFTIESNAIEEWLRKRRK